MLRIFHGFDLFLGMVPLGMSNHIAPVQVGSINQDFERESGARL